MVRLRAALLGRPVRQRRLVRASCACCLERLLKVGDNVVDVFGADRDTDSVLGDARIEALLLRKLLVCRGPGVDGEGLGVTDTVILLV